MRRLTRHHLIPRTRHKNKWNKKAFSREEVHSRIILLCRPCHTNLHDRFSEKELERDLNTLEALQNHPEIKKFTAWIRSKPIDFKLKTRRRS